MKFPSLRSTLAEGRKTLVRFPLVIADALLGTAIALVLVDVEGPPRPTILFPLLLAAIAGIPLFLVCALVAEKRRLAGFRKAALHVAGALILAGYALTVPANLPDAPAQTLIRFAFIAAALHLFVAWAPFAGGGETMGFWQYNRMLFVRVLTSVLFSFILWAGLAIALAALDHLFGVSVPGKRYGELWILVSGAFATWFFLGGIPDDIAALDSVTETPRWISVFSRYVLIPLVLVYLVILYAYIVKIVVEWSWPEGWVSRMILGLACAGTFAQLLLHPSVAAAPGGWAARFSRWFSLFLIPLAGVLALAVLRRASDYGMTEGRYTGLVIAGWLASTALYSAATRGKRIMVIPVSLSLIALAVSAGPWGALAVSERSQVARLRTILERDSLLVGGTIRPAGAGFSRVEGATIGSVLSYLQEVHGYDGIQDWFAKPLTVDSSARGRMCLPAQDVAGMLGVTYRGGMRLPGGILILRPDELAGYDIRGYATVCRIRTEGTGSRPIALGGGGVLVTAHLPSPRDPNPLRPLIVNVYTAPAHRRRGIARRLLEIML
ncbi:MAG TPA: DUF4153 domain-containing protein, partial [Bacteroidota bacterium]|nr:DUF4153 domain-containing protein [Bacteroidota bacterium]